MTEFQFTPQHRSFFETFGYLYFPGLFQDRIDRIIEEFEAVWASRDQRGYDGKQHNGSKRTSIVPFPDQSEYLSTLLDDPRLIAIISGLIGDDFSYSGGDGNLFATDGNWHSDGYSPERYRIVKAAFYLDPVTRETGALRVIPGSHHCGDKFAQAVEQGVNLGKPRPENYPQWNITPEHVPCVVLETTPGDLIVFHQNVKHVGLNGSTRRRMFAMGFMPRYPDDELEKLQDLLASEGRWLVDSVIGPAMRRTAGPERMRHLQQIIDNDFKVKAVADEHRRERAEAAGR